VLFFRNCGFGSFLIFAVISRVETAVDMNGITIVPLVAIGLMLSGYETLLLLLFINFLSQWLYIFVEIAQY